VLSIHIYDVVNKMILLRRALCRNFSATVVMSRTTEGRFFEFSGNEVSPWRPIRFLGDVLGFFYYN
jgi:hypothetical protein